MYVVLNMCHRVNAHTPQERRADLVCYLLKLIDVAFQMHACQGWCILDNALRPRMKLPNRYTYETVVQWKHWMMLHIIGQKHFTDTHKPHPSMQDLSDVVCHLLSTVARYTHSIFFLSILCWSPIPLTKVHCKMKHATSYACRPWVIIRLFVWHYKTDNCRRRTMLGGHIFNFGKLIYVGYIRCWEVTIDVSIPMFAGYQRCCQEPFNVGSPICAIFGWWWHPTFNLGWPLCACQWQYGKTMSHVSWPLCLNQK